MQDLKKPARRRLNSLRGLVFLLCLAGLDQALASETAFASSTGCQALTEADAHYVVCSFDMRQNEHPDELRLFLAPPGGKPYGSFSALATDLKQNGEQLLFAMNGGMYGTDLAPVGLFIEAQHQIHPVNQRNGSGNFHLKPNGVFYFSGRNAGIMETSAFAKSGIRPDYATQSGPMLVINGKIHPKIQSDGTSQKIRNGVGIRDGHIVVFAISNDLVTFYQFASLFRDALNCPNALYLDGSVSSLYAPGLGRADGLRQIGPIIGIVTKAAHP
jgi:uncharacterized protein YigE (DUF2233 family)